MRNLTNWDLLSDYEKNMAIAGDAEEVKLLERTTDVLSYRENSVDDVLSELEEMGWDCYPAVDDAVDWYGKLICGVQYWELNGARGQMVLTPRGAAIYEIERVKRALIVKCRHEAGLGCGNPDCGECY